MDRLPGFFKDRSRIRPGERQSTQPGRSLFFLAGRKPHLLQH